ncbi:MAG: hypothetical protein KQI35_02290 [Bacteroidetes bacterium]|nr:hypothetical protein [Bacteroidota bacterium]
MSLAILIAILFFIFVPVHGQQKKNLDFFVQNQDTTFCTHILYYSSNNCEIIKWYDMAGTGKTIECIKDAGVTAFSLNGRTYDLLTIKKGRQKYYWKKVDGPIQLFVQDFTETAWYDQNMPETETRKYIVMNNQMHRIRKKRDIKRYLLPSLVNCEGFRSGYYGKFSLEELDNMIKVYNANCNAMAKGKSNKCRDYLINVKGDTIPSMAIEIRRISGIVNGIRYTTPDGRVYSILGRSECENYPTFSINGQTFDLIPMDPSRPGAGKQHVWRKIDGRMKLYDFYREAKGIEKGLFNQETNTYDFILYTVKLEDDVHIAVTDKNLNEVLMPYFLQCEALLQAFNGEITTQREVFELVVKLFNVLCPNEPQ